MGGGGTPEVEVWFRNPHNYVRELAECGVRQVAWDRGRLVKSRIDPYKHAEVHFGATDWRVLIVGTQGTAELRPGYDMGNPVGVYPTWSAAEDDLVILEQMMKYPLGEDAGVCSDERLPPDERPVAGQEHRVVVLDLPNMAQSQGRNLARRLRELQEDYPECILHLHGLYSWKVSFGMGFGSTDIDPRTSASKGKVILPTGKEMFAERTVECQQWVEVLGMRTVDLTRDPRNCCIYNIKSAEWAGQFYGKLHYIKTRGDTPDDLDTISKKVTPVETASRNYLSRPMAVQPGDKVTCDTCSLVDACKFYREGAVCSVPNSETSSLAKFFRTRDSGTIISGLGMILQTQADRLEKGVAEEQEYGELDPHVTAMAKGLFADGVKLAKLVDPSLTRPSVQVNVGVPGAAAAVAAATPNQVVGQILAEYERRGIPRSEVTPEMLMNMLAEMSGANRAPAAIESQVIVHNDPTLG